MAADLVKSPDVAHTLHHDLESFFWVLLWIILTRVPTSWIDEERSSFVNETMSPRVYRRTRGTQKRSWLTSGSPLIKEKFQITGNPTLREFAAELLSTVSARYHVEPALTKTSSLNPFILSGGKPKTAEDQASVLLDHKTGMKFLNNYNLMLMQFENALKAEWPSNDQAIVQHILPSKSVVHVYSSKRSRSMVEENGAFNTESASKRNG